MFPVTIFDFNGVLVDDEWVHLDGLREVVRPMGITVTDEQYLERYFGSDDAGALRAILTDAGRPVTEAEIARLVELKRPFYRKRAEEALVVYDKATEVVRLCARSGPVAIVSGALRDEIDFALAKLGVTDCVSLVVSAEDTVRCKPDPEGYNLAIDRLIPLVGEANARRSLVIEDSLAGVAAAKSAGLVCLAVEHSYPRADLYRAGADHVVHRIGDVNDDLRSSLFSRLGASLGG
jgi:HAD superfamily hydrolase (TIGR01509 family)